ncbi:large ribosomal RNA subunit accumulation protein YCED homolog 2, chloroplastic isoform X1 [Quercus robur]|uniref:large ribosomal RNA subunit accumulation protein YCED homolog 2, chloroplastic isoform X1 n=1 Tax=Quercus robur TaxID=38942 RepID=UPI002163DA08|nr:large ribosomal RNA subunit accumulation protein YCED homolog 2, chloroplastic isoform X1 [Quercus robur]
MAEVGHLVSARNVSPFPSSYPTKAKSLKFQCRIRAASKRNDFSLIKRKSSRNPRRMIKISTSDGRWQGEWTCDYLLSLKDLRLQDLVEDEHKKDAQVFINLAIHKHASFGLSVDGRILTSFTRKCSICASPYCREIDTTFNVWVLPSSRDNDANQLPEIGGDDPSVIYVKPGYEADLDSLVQDTIRLTTSVKDTCSELCERSNPTLQYIGGQDAGSSGKRWPRLLELRNAYRGLHP